MNKKVRKIKNYLKLIILDNFPKPSDDQPKDYSFNKEILLREISSFKWVATICISLTIAMISSLTPLLKTKEYSIENSNFFEEVSFAIVNSVCDYPNHNYGYIKELGYQQFIDPFADIVENYFAKEYKTNVFVKNEKQGNALFNEYPNYDCKNLNKKAQSDIQLQEINYEEGRWLLENKTWNVSFANPSIDFVNYKSTISQLKKSAMNILEICKIEFSENKDRWKATLVYTPENCSLKQLETNNKIFVEGSANWSVKTIGPLVRKFDVNYPLLSEKWKDIYNLNLLDTDYSNNKFLKNYNFKIPFSNQVRISFTNKDLYLFIVVQILLLSLIFFKVINLKEKSNQLKIPFIFYLSKWFRLPLMIVLLIINSILTIELITSNILESVSMASLFKSYALMLVVFVLYINISINLLSKKTTFGLLVLYILIFIKILYFK